MVDYAYPKEWFTFFAYHVFFNTIYGYFVSIYLEIFTTNKYNAKSESQI